MNSSICLRIYFINASLDHRPIIMIAKTGTPPRYIAIAAPDRIECVPTSEGAMRSRSGPYVEIASRSDEVTCVAVTCSKRLC